MELIEYKERVYPKLQSEGYASRYAFPFAEKLCIGNGMDVGCSKIRWSFPGSLPIDISLSDEWDAMNLPDHKEGWDYIFSSHCLEHLNDWVGALNYWHSKLKPGATLFLYLPDCDHQEYWQPMSNRKHCNWLRPDMLKKYFEFGGWKNIFVTGHDLNYSFYAVAEKI